MIIIIFFIFGLIVGSFLNVVVYRLNVAETILGRSYCPQCKSKIRWYDNIPLLSFVFLRAECRDCQKKISWFYPAVELFTAAVFSLVGGLFFSASDFASLIPTVFYLTVFSVMIVIAAYDLKFMEIPLFVVWIGVGISILYYFWADSQNMQLIAQNGIFSSMTVLSLIGGAVSAIFFFSIAYFSKEKWMGMGDGYIGLLVGLVVGWPIVFPTLTLSFAIGALAGMILVALKIKGMKSQIPFAPFLVLGAMAIIFVFRMYPTWRYYF
jgi:prepilin signal peptidase PulO-like enzyme (type II secretory pathway)